MAVQTEVRPIATPGQVTTLDGLMAEPELAVSDAPLYSPSALGLLLLAALLSPKTPKERK